MWSEVFGSNPSMRRISFVKYANGDDIIQQMGKNQLISINNGQPTMWKYDKEGIELMYQVDIMDMMKPKIIFTYNINFNTQSE